MPGPFKLLCATAVAGLLCLLATICAEPFKARVTSRADRPAPHNSARYQSLASINAREDALDAEAAGGILEKLVKVGARGSTPGGDAPMPWERWRTAKLAERMGRAAPQTAATAKGVNAKMPWAKFKTSQFAQQLTAVGPNGAQLGTQLASKPHTADGLRPGGDPDAKMPWVRSHFGAFYDRLTQQSLPQQMQELAAARSSNAHMPWASSRFGDYATRVASAVAGGGMHVQELAAARSSKAHMPWASSRFGDYATRVASGGPQQLVVDRGIAASVADPIVADTQMLPASDEEADGAGGSSDQGLASAVTDTQMLPANYVEVEGAQNAMAALMPPAPPVPAAQPLQPAAPATQAAAAKQPLAAQPAQLAAKSAKEKEVESLTKELETVKAQLAAAVQDVAVPSAPATKTAAQPAAPVELQAVQRPPAQPAALPVAPVPAPQLYAPKSAADAVGMVPDTPSQRRASVSAAAMRQVATAQQPELDLAQRERKEHIGHFPWETEQRNRLFASRVGKQMYAPDARTTAGQMPYDFADQHRFLGQGTDLMQPGARSQLARGQSSAQFQSAMDAYRQEQT